MAKITVVIPTRERCDTLGACLKTCTTQDFDGLEIVIADNCSKDSTREVASSFNDRRVRYVRSPHRTGMSQNWEFGLSHASGDYVMFLGDDDGLLPGAIRELEGLLGGENWPAISWTPATYHWGNSPVVKNRYRLIVPLRDRKEVIETGMRVLEEVALLRRPYFDLPIPYVRSLVSRKVIDGLRGRNGRVIQSMIPDVYLGVAISSRIANYPQVKWPYTVAGVSHHSQGTSSLNPGTSRDAEATFLEEENLPFHPKLDYAPLTSLILWECLLQTRDHVGLEQDLASIIDDARLLKEAVRQARAFPPQRYQLCMQALHRIARRLQLERTLETAQARYPNRPKAEREEFAGYNIRQKQLVVECATSTDVSIYGAAQKCDEILSLKTSGKLSVPVLSILRTTYRLAQQRLVG